MKHFLAESVSNAVNCNIKVSPLTPMFENTVQSDFCHKRNLVTNLEKKDEFKESYSTTLETRTSTGTVLSLKAVVTKQPKVKAAMTLRENAKRELALDKTVFIFSKVVMVLSCLRRGKVQVRCHFN